MKGRIIWKVEVERRKMISYGKSEGEEKKEGAGRRRLGGEREEKKKKKKKKKEGLDIVEEKSVEAIFCGTSLK